MGCGASTTSVAIPKTSNAGQGQPNPTQPNNNPNNSAARTREYYRNSLGNDFIEGFSRTGQTLSQKSTTRSSNSCENIEMDNDRQSSLQAPDIKDVASTLPPPGTRGPDRQQPA
jgi:hypothetical protein